LVKKDRIAYSTDGEAPATTTTDEEGAVDTGDGDDGGGTRSNISSCSFWFNDGKILPMPCPRMLPPQLKCVIQNLH
jgi:hypothetical protein